MVNDSAKDAYDQTGDDVYKNRPVQVISHVTGKRFS